MIVKKREKENVIRRRKPDEEVIRMEISEKTFPLFEMVRNDGDVNVYINEQNKSMKALHYYGAQPGTCRCCGAADRLYSDDTGGRSACH